jgi:hypothetical protein
MDPLGVNSLADMMLLRFCIDGSPMTLAESKEVTRAIENARYKGSPTDMSTDIERLRYLAQSLHDKVCTNRPFIGQSTHEPEERCTTQKSSRVVQAQCNQCVHK